MKEVRFACIVLTDNACGVLIEGHIKVSKGTKIPNDNPANSHRYSLLVDRFLENKAKEIEYLRYLSRAL